MKNNQLAHLGSIFILNFGLKILIDFVLNPILILEVGFLFSLSITVLIYTLFGIISIKMYDYYKIDFLMIEAFKKSQSECEQTENPLLRFIRRRAKKNKKTLGLLLSSQNSGLFVLYFREGFHQYNGFQGENIKKLFFLNLFIIELYWNTILYTGFSLWKFIAMTT